ncbi:DSBA-like thioredoxin domain protein [Acinetobacter baumannii 1289546]|nr:DSBA-like thioredoxin domain protein [Acinetobacter baumannii 1289546]
MRVDVWSDVVCPFCYIGKKRLEHVAAEAGIELDIHWHSFERLCCTNLSLKAYSTI